MKKIILVFMTFVLILALSLISCDELLAGIGSNFGNGDTESISSAISIQPMPPETMLNGGEEQTYICVNWMDFVRIDGVIYDGRLQYKTIDESKIGYKIGEIKYKVGSSFASYEEMAEANTANFASSIRPVGCEVFTVTDDERSIAVLDGGKYYLYTCMSGGSIKLEVWGGEIYGLPGEYESNRVVAINTFDQLCEAFGGEDAIPAELKEKYDGNKLQEITLIVVSLVSGWGGTEYGISSVSKSGDDLLVNVIQLDSSGAGDDAMHYWTYYIEIPKTDDKKIGVNCTTVDPLQNDQSIVEIPYDKMSKYLKYQTETDHSRYDGKAVLSKDVAEEVARSLDDYSYYDADIRYCTVNNYWLVNLTRWINSGGHSVDYVIRAADGKVIAIYEDYYESIE